MTYKAIIMLPNGNLSKEFSTVMQAEQWLDSVNNNFEHTTIVQEVNNNMVVDWFYYTEAAK